MKFYKALLILILAPTSFTAFGMHIPRTEGILIEHARTGNLSGVMPFINAQIDLDRIRNRYGNTALMAAAKNRRSEVVKALLKGGASPNLQDNKLFTALMKAAISGDKDSVDALLANKRTDVDLQDINGNTAIMFAAKSQYSNPEIIFALLAKGANPNIQTKSKDTPLLQAALDEKIDLVNALLADKRTNPNIQNQYGYTALTCAILNGNKSIVDALLARGDINLDLQDKRGQTALIASVGEERSSEEISKALLKAGAKPNIQDNNGNTALMDATYQGNREIVDALLEAGADPKLQNNDDETALMGAAFQRYREIVDALLAKGVDPNLQNSDGNTALMGAASQGNREIVDALLEAGANPNLKDNDGKTALDYAEAEGHKEIEQMLQEAANRLSGKKRQKAEEGAGGAGARPSKR